MLLGSHTARMWASCILLSAAFGSSVPVPRCMTQFQFECHSGECIAIYNACDGIPQCQDGSDELDCPSDAYDGRHRRQSQLVRYKPLIIGNVTANTKANSRLFTVPGAGAGAVEFNVSQPRLFRVDQDGAVYSRVDGRELLKSAGSRNFTVYSHSPDTSRLIKLPIFLATDNRPPQFSDTSYKASIFENAAEGSLVIAVLAQDPESDPITYWIRHPGQPDHAGEHKMFTINPKTGVIRLINEPLSFDDEIYTFTVTARDTHNNEATAPVTVAIIDVNNHRPEFPDCDSYQASVEENKEPGTSVITVRATDADKGVNAELVYALVTSPSSPESLFDIDKQTGKLTTAKKFNRDAPDHEKSLRVIVKATDKGSPSLEGTCEFVVNVLDVNDNDPMFDKKSYEDAIAKDAKVDTQVERVSAMDDDVGENGNITYSLLSATPPKALTFFKIEPRTGVIRLIASLSEFPIDSEIQLEAVATDHGTPARSATVPVFITVKDSSVQPPTFTVLPQPLYRLPENYRDTETPIATLRAVSNLPDSPRVYYEIMHGPQEQTNKYRTFVVEEDDNGDAIVRYGGSRQLDYEQVTTYNLTVVAKTDQQTKAEATFQVVLEDKNDEVPIFYDTDKAVVPENEPANTFVATVTAIDRDKTSPNNLVTYRIDKDSPEYQLFSIESGSGRISTRVPLDREDESRPSPFYTVTVIAEDGAPSDITKSGEHNKAKHRITVEVGDVNDNPPRFDTGVDTAWVDENADIGSKVFDIVATDVDSDSKINYQITDGNFGAAFGIDPDTGVVTVKGPIDYETLNKYDITITASDGKFEDSHKVVIEVHNINDVAPKFDQDSYELKMQEGYLSPKPILTVRATDPDPVGLPSIIYKLSGPGIYPDRPEDDVFSINNDGQVVVLKTLDRDKGTGGREIWELTINAWDDGGSGLASTAHFRLTLTDINDNPPYLIQTNPVIMENKSPDDIVVFVEADDFDDHDKNGPPYSFKLDPAADDDIRTKFTVKTGSQGTGAEIRPLVTFDREQQKQYVIPVVVSDNIGADPRSLTGTSLFTVIIGDENDNDMKPGSSVISVFNYEGKMPTTVIGRVYVDDPDDWDLPDKTFRWASQRDRHFQLDEDTGNITMMAGTTNGTYSLKFTVRDRKFQSEVDADVTVVVRLLPRVAVLQSGSIRIKDITAQQFISPPRKDAPSLYERMIGELSKMFETAPENVDLFGVQTNEHGGVDVRYAAHGSPYYDSERMDGQVGQHRKQLEETLKIEIEQVNIDDCIYEKTCHGSCYSSLHIFENEVYSVKTNISSVVGVRTEMQYACGHCEPPPPEEPHCLNGGRLLTDQQPPKCECSNDNVGPNCEGLTIHFDGSGYAWFPKLTACNASHVSFDLITSASEGLVMYDGPVFEPTENIQDFFAVDVHKGRLRVFLNYGKGTAVASPESEIGDGRRHHIDITWNAEELTVLVDSCVGLAQCQDTAPAPVSDAPHRHALLNVDGPLQLGGTAVPLSTVRTNMAWLETPTSAGFAGCIQNVTFLSTIYDLSNPAYGSGYSSTCEEIIVPVPVVYASSSFIAVLIACIIFVLILLVAAFVLQRRRRRKDPGYKDPRDSIRMEIRDEEGGSEKDNASYDMSTLRIEDKQNGGPGSQVDGPVLTGAAAVIQDRMAALESGDDLAEGDNLRNYAYEGGGSSAGSLSTINSGTSDGDQEFGFLVEMGPRFRKLADLYGASAEGSDSEGSSAALPYVVGSTHTESWC